MAAPTYGKREASPGFFGALKDAIKSTAKGLAPRSVTDRKANLDSASEDPASYRKRQSRQHNSDNY
jgi:hypothetical protein